LNLQSRSYGRGMRGFSLVELMVGLVIGMVAIIVVMQVFLLSEGAKRTSTGGDDAQNSGAIALSALQRDVRQGGYAVSLFALAGCNLALPGGWTVGSMSSVTVNHVAVPAGDANTDTLLVMYGSSAGSSEGDLVNTQPATAKYAVATPTSFAANDVVVAAVQPQPSPCNLTMERVTAAPAPEVVVTTGVAGMLGGSLYNLGPAPQVLVYAIRGEQLTVCDYMVNNCGLAANTGNSAIWVPIGEGIVSLRAEYGRDTSAPMDAVVDEFVQTTPTTACGWMRISALRLAVVARSGQYEKTDVTTDAIAPRWTGSASQPITLSARADWRRYRYKTYETTVPLRNMAWQGVQAGC
jgi:type IV pilus assembly protein PilW